MKHHLLPIATVLVLAIAGCTGITHKINVRYAPVEQSPLATLKPATVLIQVEDQRPAEERGYVSKWEGGPLDPTHRFVTRESPVEILRSALRQEFQRNGHRVVDMPSAEVEININIVLQRFIGAVVGADKMAQIQAEVSVRKVRATEAATPFPVAGTYKTHYVGIALITADPSNELALAMQDFVKNLALDSRFLETFEQR